MTFRKHLWEEKKPNPQLLGGLTDKMTFSKSRWKTMLWVIPYSGSEREYMSWLFSKFYPLLPHPIHFLPFSVSWDTDPFRDCILYLPWPSGFWWGLANGDQQVRSAGISFCSYSAWPSDSGGGCIPPRLWFPLVPSQAPASPTLQ